MLLGISGTAGSGRHVAINYMKTLGFQELRLGEHYNNADELIDYVTPRWREDFVFLLDTLELVQAAEHRPFFLHLSIDAPLRLRFSRSGCQSLEEFVEISDERVYENNGAKVFLRAHVVLINNFSSIEEFQKAISDIDLLDQTRMRPGWDAYFMKLADLAAQRSNCMKRRVGCVLVREKRVIATGYNGTPRGMTNCNEGGCKRCNSAQVGGSALSTCLCLHAEENALLESGRDRLGTMATLYCNTCPCLTCSIKIVQSGIKEVIYSQNYSMDEQSAAVFKEANVILRQYHPPSAGLVEF